MNILFAVKFPFQRYIVSWGNFYRSKIIGGGGRPEPPPPTSPHLPPLFCKIVYLLHHFIEIIEDVFL